MKDYKIFEFDNNSNENVVFMNTTEDLYFYQTDIYNELSKCKGKDFSILVDLFLRNGYSFNRYIELQFIGCNNYRSLVVNPREVSDEIKKAINLYLKGNSELLNNSALTEATIDFVLRN